MTRSRSTRFGASTLMVTLTALTALSLMAAYTFRRVMPRFAMAYQNAAWQEARLAAEAGVDMAMTDLLRNTPSSGSSSWPAWKQNSNGVIGPVLSTTLGQLTGLLSALFGGPPASATAPPIFLDNVRISGANGLLTEVDVQLWSLQPSDRSRNRWFRIRSMATCALPPQAYPAGEQLDGPLRRLSLRSMRPQLRDDDMGDPLTIPTPNVSRTIEVLVEPILPFELALWTDHSLSLGTSGPWGVDSYDSRDPGKSNVDGTYPGRGSAKVQENGNIANNRGRSGDSLYGSLISANGARVRGIVATNGGDNPETSIHENVSGAAGIDPARVRDDFQREMKPIPRPSIAGAAPMPLLGLPFLSGSEAQPTRYHIAGELGAFEVAAPTSGKGAVIIMVDGGLDVGSGGIVIPPGVTVQLFVRGNIDFRNQAINTSAQSSKRPAQLLIYGEDARGLPRRLRAFGSATIAAAFYGPHYDVSLTGGAEWFGAVGSRSFEMMGGGHGGFHYDEALAQLGPPISFRIVRYVEDVRQ